MGRSYAAYPCGVTLSADQRVVNERHTAEAISFERAEDENEAPSDQLFMRCPQAVSPRLELWNSLNQE
jgi:hypothetical protein